MITNSSASLPAFLPIFNVLKNVSSDFFLFDYLIFFLLSVETTTLLINFDLKACLIAFPISVVFLNFKRFLFLIPFEFPLAQIKAIIFIMLVFFKQIV